MFNSPQLFVKSIYNIPQRVDQNKYQVKGFTLLKKDIFLSKKGLINWYIVFIRP